MRKNILSIAILVICTLCLIVGITVSIQKHAAQKAQTINNKKNTNFVKTFNEDRIVLIEFNGVIDSSDNSGYFNTSMNAKGLQEAIDTTIKDTTAKGIILKLNTPGGTVAMSQSIYDRILHGKEKKPIVVVMDDVVASGGYYIASAADRIYAQRGTLTGSIGVIFSTMDIHELLAQKLLIKPNVIKSGKFKDIGSQIKPMTPEERALLQDIIDESYDQFITDITKGRIERSDKYTTPKQNLKAETLKKYADGRVFTGTQALEYGFVDDIGDTVLARYTINQMAIEKFNLAKNTKLPVEKYTKYQNFSEYFFGSLASKFNLQPNSELQNYIPTSMKMSKQPLYLWE